MKKFFTFCLAGVIALAAAFCSDDNEGGKSNQMTINGQTETIQRAYYDFYTQASGARRFLIELTPSTADITLAEPTTYFALELMESQFGKTIDLSKPLDTTDDDERLATGVINDVYKCSIELDKEEVSAWEEPDSDDQTVTVTSGTLKVTNNGDHFTIEMAATLSNGKSFSAKWKGEVTKTDLGS